MKNREFLYPLLLVGAIFAAIPQLKARKNSPEGPKEPAHSEAHYDPIHAYIRAQMRRLKIPGISLVIVEGDQIVHCHGFGRARPGGKAPTPQTPFMIGSTTKSITASAVMQLVEAGKVNLDSPVQQYLPWFRAADTVPSAHITVRHLLNQTSGLPAIPGIVVISDLDDRPDACLRQAQALSSVELSHFVGAAFEYSNLNYNLLGLVIEAASGETYADYIQRHILDPLKMKHSYVSLAAAQQDGLAAGHRYWFGQPVATRNPAIAPGSLPSGQLISSAEDMAHYLIALLNQGRYGGARILSSASIEEMQRGAAQQLVFGKPITAYGMGWFVHQIDGLKVVSHGGNVPEFSAYMALIPGQNIGVVFLANADPCGVPMVLMEVGDGVAALLAGKQPAPIQFGFIPWVIRASALVPFLQSAGIFATLRQRRRRQRRPTQVRKSNRTAILNLLALIPDLLLATLLNYLRASGLLRFLRLYIPDLAIIAQASGGLASISAYLRATRLLRQKGH